MYRQHRGQVQVHHRAPFAIAEKHGFAVGDEETLRIFDVRDDEVGEEGQTSARAIEEQEMRNKLCMESAVVTMEVQTLINI